MFREAFYISITFLNVLISPKCAKSNHVYRCRDKADKFKQEIRMISLRLISLSKDGTTVLMTIDRKTTKR